ncbi:hypothetical protein AN4692.2 [Aspergillus nidulans FGSC A4]|uniref:Nitrogen regulatory protein areA GATA-like domain-containing protein n=1 Tax=Emericella nidulans (strain FGSC A4 / ATCC 38163 / CBS 112.46 / NRRL 194 / M139) TaxID=227321 RepID=Q5B438_EMENI|nr:hypothetical protein [Aspergillus nidulans FGSC A4]EAA60734.1 hypothetical protein AN4692.2 [Aspergillus nidulans FGSC A4]CBF76988.1 TPA: hypothetical protein ANIA_04692 [Aspergillus nidulans FGSC A4]|eukprot:XP_662296.1 hypothetical protein AN4692.2 [Aspergillus nidulans FGSC A4]
METLPKGLIAVSEKVSEGLDDLDLDVVDIGDIVQLWKACSINPSAHEGDAGYRLQNLFWRIWGSKRLSSSLTGSALSRLFLQISEPASTPTPANRSTTFTSPSFRPPAKTEEKVGTRTHRHFPCDHAAAVTVADLQMQESEPLSSSLKRDEQHPKNQHQHQKQQRPPSHGKSQSHPTPGASNSGTKPLQPVLKKSNSSSHGEVQKTTRLLLTGLGGQSVTRKPSNPPTPIPPSRPILFGEPQAPGATSRAGQKKTFAVASKAKAKTPKRRPVLMRRKSSQQSSVSVSSTRTHSPQTDFGDLPSIDSDNDKTNTAAVLDEDAVEDSPDEMITTRIAPITTPNPNPSTSSTISTTITDKSTSTSSTPAPFPPLPSEEQTFEPDEMTKPALPSPFIQDLKTLMHKNTPLPPLRPHASPPTVGFFSATACRHFDVRHLSEENYEQPNSSELVAPDFRTRFAEQKRIADEYYAQLYRRNAEQGGQEQNDSYGQGQGQVALGLFAQNTNLHPADEVDGAGSPGAGTTTEETETISPSKSRFGDSHSHTQSHGASTVATSILTGGSASAGPDIYHGAQGADTATGMLTGMDPASIQGHDRNQELGIEHGHRDEHQYGSVKASANAATSAMAVPMSVPGTGNLFSTPPGLSLPRGRGGLSLLIEQSRHSMVSQEMGKLTTTGPEKERSDKGQ